MKETDKRVNAVIVGGGPGCKAIMELILCDRFSQLNMNILGVASRNPGSPGAVYAKGLGIYLTSDYRDFYRVGVTSQKVRGSMLKGDELFPESLMIRNGFLASRRIRQSSRSVCILNNKFLKGRDFVGFGETINKVVPEGNAQLPTCFL